MGTLNDVVKTVEHNFAWINSIPGIQFERYFRRKNAIKHIKTLYSLFKKEENPLFVWEAYRVARREDFSLPDWVLNYFDEAAKYLTTHEAESDPWPIVRDALRLDTWGQGNTFSRYHNAKRRFRAMERVIEAKKINPRRTLQNIFSDVAGEMHLSNITVENWYYALRKVRD
jgi:hypothetical protein